MPDHASILTTIGKTSASTVRFMNKCDFKKSVIGHNN